MDTVKLIKSVVIKTNVCSIVEILVQAFQIFSFIVINWRLVNVLYSVDCNHCSHGCVETQTVRIVFGKHIHFYRLVSCYFECVGFQDLFYRLNFLYYFVDLVSSVNTTAEIERVVPVEFRLRPTVLQKLDSRERLVWFENGLKVRQAHYFVCCVTEVNPRC